MTCSLFTSKRLRCSGARKGLKDDSDPSTSASDNSSPVVSSVPMQPSGSSLHPPPWHPYGVQQKSALDTPLGPRRGSEQDVLRSLPRPLEPSSPHTYNAPTDLSESTSRNLVVCIDGTAKQIGMKVKIHPTPFDSVLFLQTCRTRMLSSCALGWPRTQSNLRITTVGLARSQRNRE